MRHKNKKLIKYAEKNGIACYMEEEEYEECRNMKIFAGVFAEVMAEKAGCRVATLDGTNLALISY